MLELKNYQKRSLETLETYLVTASAVGAKTAFIQLTGWPYREVTQLPGLPYLCLRVPTGGGKTVIGCHAVGIAAKTYLQTEHAVCLWLVPTSTIKDQTLKALKDKKNAYRQVLEAAFGGLVQVIDLAEALYIQQSTISHDTVVIVSTLAALRVEDTEGRKIYEASGSLQHHFSGLPVTLEDVLEKREDGQVACSLANVLRLWRPVIIMDEAHNARTPLSFEALARFNPSCIIEFTATPETMHKPQAGKFASNVLHHVSAAELKAEEMVKLPIKLCTRENWKDVLKDTVTALDNLEQIAREEERATQEYIRPIALIQAQPKMKAKDTLTVEVVRKALLEELDIPAAQVAIATGETNELEGVNLFERSCPIRFIITIYALKEGWDCPFAYVLCSVADLASSRAVEQVLGRVLRLPRACRKHHPELNYAYAMVSSHRFLDAAQALTDCLVENGFERLEANKLVTPDDGQLNLFESLSTKAMVTEEVREAPNLSLLPETMKNRVSYDLDKQQISVTGVISEQDKSQLQKCFKTLDGMRTVERIYNRSRGRVLREDSPAGRGEPFPVPQLAIRVGKQLELFEDSHFLRSVWKLSDYEAVLTEQEFTPRPSGGTAGEVDVSSEGKLEVRYVETLLRQLTTLRRQQTTTIAKLVDALDRQIFHPDITRIQASLFLHRLITYLLEERGFSLQDLDQERTRLRTAVAGKIDKYRRKARTQAYQEVLFSNETHEIEVSPALCFSFTEDRYAPNWYYDGSYRFKKSFFSLVGELKGKGEEFECAQFLDTLTEVKYWVRNLERRPDTSFWLQTSTDKFYPDFVALLHDGRILVVEYKSERDWSNDDSKEKRALGELWAERSRGSCLFVMPKGPDWNAIAEIIRK